jgi:hypothetical protein
MPTPRRQGGSWGRTGQARCQRRWRCRGEGLGHRSQRSSRARACQPIGETRHGSTDKLCSCPSRRRNPSSWLLF